MRSGYLAVAALALVGCAGHKGPAAYTNGERFWAVGTGEARNLGDAEQKALMTGAEVLRAAFDDFLAEREAGAGDAVLRSEAALLEEAMREGGSEVPGAEMASWMEGSTAHARMRVDLEGLLRKRVPAELRAAWGAWLRARRERFVAEGYDDALPWRSLAVVAAPELKRKVEPTRRAPEPPRHPKPSPERKSASREPKAELPRLVLVVRSEGAGEEVAQLVLAQLQAALDGRAVLIDAAVAADELQVQLALGCADTACRKAAREQLQADGLVFARLTSRGEDTWLELRALQLAGGDVRSAVVTCGICGAEEWRERTDAALLELFPTDS